MYSLHIANEMTTQEIIAIVFFKFIALILWLVLSGLAVVGILTNRLQYGDLVGSLVTLPLVVAIFAMRTTK